MYKIYINENCLLIVNKDEAQLIDKESVTVFPYLSGKKYLLNFIDKLEKSKEATTLALVTKDDRALFKEVRSLYKVIKAAGGLCLNEEQEILFIERLGYWDLPKGKVDKGESIEEAAIREIHEETGQQCQILDKIGKTWHTYYDRNNRRILKKTYWYKMKVNQNIPVVIQEEENITDFRWINAAKFLESDLPTYQSIKEIVRKMHENR